MHKKVERCVPNHDDDDWMSGRQFDHQSGHRVQNGRKQRQGQAGASLATGRVLNSGHLKETLVESKLVGNV
jgi:hypothetical protein